jgi:hypothetical protein
MPNRSLFQYPTTQDGFLILFRSIWSQLEKLDIYIYIYLLQEQEISVASVGWKGRTLES